MGASTKTLTRLQLLRDRGILGAGSEMLELGTQNLWCSGGASDLKDFLESFTGAPAGIPDGEIAELADGGLLSRVMKHCGIGYLALDIFDQEATMLFDLNVDATPPDMVGKYDIVTNFGTTEHLIGQHNAMKVVHEFTKVGGVIYHDVPMGGYFYHGYYNYTPLFFKHLAAANDYEIVFCHFSKPPASFPYDILEKQELLENGWPDPGFHNAGIEFILRKTKDAPFRVPIETSTSHAINEDFMKSRDPEMKILNTLQAERAGTA